MHPFTGTGVAVVTPFDQSHQLDLPALQRVLEHLIVGGVEYLVALGTTGESTTLSADEQKQLLDTIFAVCKGKAPVVIGAGGNNTLQLCEKVEALTKAYPEAAGILSVSPAYNKPQQAGIYQHYRAVAESTDLPIILYNVPGRTASNLAAETTLRLAHDLPNVVAVKEASGKLEQVMEIIRQRPEGFAVLSGDDLLSLPIIAMGGEGTISVTANALPDPFSRMIRAALAGDGHTARRLHYALMPLIELNFAEGNPAGVKGMMALQNLCGPAVRLPLVSASPALSTQMQQALDAADWG
jgi:4-hydroxy-tetrahydrodipicolinate synthase